MENKPILSQSLASVDNAGKPKKGLLASIKKRHVLAFYAFFGFFIAYTLRANLSVAIVDMSHANFHKVESSSPSPTSTTTPNSDTENKVAI